MKLLRSFLLCLGLGFAASAASAATLTVTSPADSGSGTLRAQLAAAAPGDVIDFMVTGAITLTSGELLIDKDLAIIGPGPLLLTVERSAAPGTPDFRIFTHTIGTALISGLTIQNGRTNSGGGVLSQDELVLSNCVVTGNVATNDTGPAALGGGVWNDQAPLEILSCVFSNNLAAGASTQGQGGGVANSFAPIFIADSRFEENGVRGGTGAKGGGFYNEGSAIFTNVVLRANQAQGATDGQGVSGEGGGIFNAAGTARLRACTIADNAAAGGDGTNGDGGTSFGGGVANDFGTVRLDRCTVSGNSAGGGDSTGGAGGTTLGGGLSNLGGTITLTNSTLSGNRITAGTGGTPIARGGGIYSEAGSLSALHVTIVSNTVAGTFPASGAGVHNLDAGFEPRNTIVAANSGALDLANGGTGTTDSGGNNLIGTSSGIINSAAGDQLGVSPAALALGPLQDNGGLTATHALLCGSIAINAGDNTDAPLGDQRGFPRVVAAFADVGAFEAAGGGGGGAAGLVLTKQCPLTPVAPGGLFTFTGSISNSGSTLLTNVSVVNDQLMLNTAVTNFDQLPPGQSLSFTGSYVLPSSFTACSITNTLTATAVDSCSGNPLTNNASATCPVAHQLALTCPPTTNFSCLSDVPAVDPADVSVLSTAGGVTVLFAGESAATNGCLIVITRTYTATDACSNTAMCDHTLSVQDTNPPTLTCPPGLLFNTDAGTCARSNVTFAATAMDNCGPAAVFCLPPTGSTFAAGTNPVTCVATDACGNTNRCTFLVTVLDTEPPQITTCATNRALAAGTNCQATLPDLTGELEVSDNCTAPGLLTPVQFPAPGTMLAVGTNTVTFTVTDQAGNSNTCQAVVTVADVTPPTPTCPSEILTNTAPGRCETVVLFTASATDNCPGVTVTCSPTNGAAFPKGTNVVHCTALDASSNAAMCSFLIVVRDLEPPQALCPLSLVLTNDPGTCRRSNVTFAADATDNCPGATPTCTPPSGSTFAVGTNTVLCLATDTAGNTNSCSFIVAVLDAEPPRIFNCATNRLLLAESNCQATLPDLTAELVVTDNCSTFTLTQSPAPGTLVPIGTNIVTFVVVDSAGNSNTCSALLIVLDLLPPLLACPSEILTNTAPGLCETVVLFTASATDNCPGVTVTCSPTNGAAFPTGTNVVHCTALDASSNTAMCSFLIVVRDLEPPQALCPLSLVLTNDPGTCGRSNVVFAADATDNCPGATPNCTPPSGSTFAVGTNTVLCLATDPAGNTNACGFIVTVLDAEPPRIFNCATNRLLLAESNCQATLPDLTAELVVTDNCSTFTLTQSPAPGTLVPIGTNIVTFVVVDSAGNSNTCSALLIVLDLLPPLLACPSEILTNTAPGLCETVVLFTASATDNCPGVTVTCSPTNGAAFPTGTNVVHCTALDASSNTAMCSFLIVVRDLEPPQALCPLSLVLTNDPGTCRRSNVTFAADATDNCPGATPNCTPPSGSTFAVGTNTVLCLATDTAGNTNACSFNVTVLDAEPPRIFNCATNRLLLAESNCQATLPDLTAELVVTDNCSTFTLTQSPAPGTLVPIGTNIVTFVVVDSAGNSNTCSALLIVLDLLPPLLACPSEILTNTAPGRCETVVLFTASATDNCPGVTVTCSPTNGAAFPKGTNVVHCTALDASSNAAMCSFLIVVRDLEPPQALCPLSLVLTNDPGTCRRSNVTFAADATDNCPGATPTCTPPSGSTFAVGTNTVLCLATDTAGNTNSCSFIVAVLDAEPPRIFNCATNRLLLAESNCQATLPDLTAELVVTDNCSTFTLTQSPAPGTLVPIGTNIVTFVVVDSAGNSNTCSALLIVLDLLPPLLACPSEILTNTAPGRCETVVLFTASATDNCPGVTVTCSPTNGAAFPKGTNVVHCTALDASSNTAMCSFLIIVRDLEPPQPICPTDFEVDIDPGTCAKTNVTFAADVMDNCPGASLVCAPPSGSTFQRGTNVVRCTGTDAAGNTNTSACTFAVIVRDNQPPVLTCGPTNKVIECGTPFAFDAPLSLDVCDGAAAAISIVSTTTNALCGNTFAATRTWRATDSAGNPSTCRQTVTVLDRQPPEVFCSSNLTVECGTPCDFTRPTALDGCHGTNVTITVLGDVTNRLCGMTYSATRTWQVIDPCSNVATCRQTITFVDTRPPLLQCPPNHVFECPAVCGFDPPSVFDLCDGTNVNLIILSTVTNASCGKTFSAARTWRATDQCGNVSTCAQHIAIIDTRPPLVVCSEDRMVPCGVAWNFEAPFGYDLCAGVAVSVTVVDTVTNALCSRTIRATRTWAVSDCASNTTLCSQTVTEVDALAPTLNCGANFSVRCGTPWQFPLPGASDNCDGTNVFVSILSTMTNDLGGGRFEAVRVWTASDVCGNSGTCTQIVTIDCAMPAPRLAAIVRQKDGATTLVIDGERDCVYTIEGSDDLASWRRIATRLNEDGSIDFIESAGSSPRFYRVVVEP